VLEGDHDPDGFAIAANMLSLTSGTIQDEAGNDAVLDHDSVPAAAIQCVDARNLPPTFDQGTSATRTMDEERSLGASIGMPLTARIRTATP
jgi:hypothetical protein